MIFSRQNKQTPDVRTKVGKVLAIENGLLDVVTTGGSAVFRRVRCAGTLPNAGDKVMVSFYKNNEIVATPVSSKDLDTVSDSYNISGTGGITIYQGTGYTIGDGLNLSGGNVLSVKTTLNRTQITGSKVDVDTGLLPSPVLADAGKSLIANGANSSSWGWPVNGSYGHLPVFGADGHSLVDSTWKVDGANLYTTGEAANYISATNVPGSCDMMIYATGSTTGQIRLGVFGVTSSKIHFDLEDGIRYSYIEFKSDTGVEFMGQNGYMSTWNGPTMALDGDGAQTLTLHVNSSPGLILYADDGNQRFVLSSHALRVKTPDQVSWQEIEAGKITANGNVVLKSGAITATFQLGASGTPTLTLPVSSGTLALTSDINTAVSGTSGKIAKFTGTNAVGNSIITESGATISVAGALTAIGQSDTNQLIVKGHSTQTAAQIVIQSNAGAEWLSIRGLANGSVLIGKEAGPSLTSADSIAIGYRAMNGVTSSHSVAIGTRALEVMNTSGHTNIAIGSWALKQLTSGLYCVSVGEGALYAITTGINCLGLGTNTGWNVTGSGNVGIGAFAMYYTSTGTDSVYIGTSAGVRVNGTGVTMIGTETGQGAGSTFSISYSTYIGYRSGYNGSTLGNYNTGVGAETLQKNVANATAVGYKAGNVQTGAGFTAIGYQAGLLSTSGTNSTLIGSGAGASLTTNGGCVMIGYQAGNAETAANKLYIANSSTTTPLIYGDFSTPSLTFNGTVNIQDGKNMVFSGTTGTKLGSTASEKLGVWGATPIVQPTTGVAAATFTANSGTAVNDASTFDGYTVKQIVKALRNIGLLA